MSDVASKLKVSELDFDTIKTNLKNFLSDQNELSDYNFDGSAMSVLLDLLAYNTHYNAFYLNMIVNEMFLDTASIRNSVVSRAKHLGYTPLSVRGARAYVDLTITPADTPATIVVEKDTQFSSTINGISYIFATANSTTVNVNSNGVYTTANVELSQGIPLTHRYTANTQDPDQKFVLPNANTDTSTLTVRIQTSATSSNLYAYALANDTTTVNSTANTYWLEESEDGKYEVVFGDGVVGRKPITGNIVLLSSLVADSTETNGAKTFSAVSDVGGYSNVAISTRTVASGGSDRDSISKIKFNAPRNYQAQNRAVTINDYIRILQRDYPAAESVIAWGGETSDPPVYGKVYIAIKPASGLTLSTATKNYIKDTVLGKRNVVSITPEIQNPDYMYVTIDSTVKYDSTKTTKSAETIKSTISNTIYQYGVDNLENFSNEFRYSPMVKKIDETESSIESSLTTVKLKRSFTPTLNVALSYTLNYSNELFQIAGAASISSTQFSHRDDSDVLRTSCSLQDSNGVMQVYRTVGASRVTVANNVGSVTYGSGKVALTTFAPVVISDGSANVAITVTLASSDVTPIRDQILLISNSDITIAMVDTAGTGTDTSVSSTSASGSTTGGSAGSGGAGSSY
tara:strand:+ start:2606 stop:4492 length:1887 start_codon:yes stop_codon:yes gene_type:complete